MIRKVEQQDVGAAIPARTIIAIIMALLLIAGGLLTYNTATSENDERSVVVATGPDTGTYHGLGKILKILLENSGDFDRVELQATDGSEDNIRLITAAGAQVDLAFAQADAATRSNASLVATLYEEVLHVLVSNRSGDSINTLYDLEGRRVALGPAGSGTRELAGRVLDQFAITPAENLILTPAEAARGLADGSIDAAFMLAAIPSRLVSELASSGKVRFLSLGDSAEPSAEAEALARVFLGVERSSIPRSTYQRLPQATVHTIGVSAVLVARRDLDEELVRQITQNIFEARDSAISLSDPDLLVARQIRENYDPANAAIPYHPGATAYYRREDPPFFVEYAEALSLGMTLLLALYSVVIAIREWTRRRMKNRVDAFLFDIEQLVAGRETADIAGLEALLEQLEGLRREALEDLIAERLLADEAFTILQHHLRDEISATTERMNRLRQVPSA